MAVHQHYRLQGFHSLVSRRAACPVGRRASTQPAKLPRASRWTLRQVAFALSQRGARLLLFDGYSYSHQCVKNDFIHWKCTMGLPGTTRRCNARLYTTIDYKVIDLVGNHRHMKPIFAKRNNTMVRVRHHRRSKEIKSEPL
ncbi:uncharacterized protein LOC123868808 isoform X1 [Maniola jurtina]|uniref:uncharacterized protein LOC123868808 isoform X1 n=1 Tax=Maniola jurtina TaxID=191418 RepID=UPI001E689A65|nr:uncharacterized protein LOC123868808 isoform X1 [Maniola jurtina]